MAIDECYTAETFALWKKKLQIKTEEHLVNIPDDAIVQPKIDGASGLIHIDQDGNVEVYSYRISTDGKPIVHTERIFGKKIRIPGLPKEYTNTVLRGEIYAVTKDGQAVNPQTINRLLNSTPRQSRWILKNENLQPRIALFDVEQVNGAAATEPYQNRYRHLEKITDYLPNDVFHSVEKYPAKEATRLLTQIKNNQHPLTKEGIVVHFPSGPSWKIKLRPEHDVYIVDIFPGQGKYRGVAGGFLYSWEPQGTPVGRVGTGLSDELRSDMWFNKQDYIGRVARVSAQEKFPSGALRAPAFIAFHEDYPLGISEKEQ